jgi:hypothetical protein
MPTSLARRGNSAMVRSYRVRVTSATASRNSLTWAWFCNRYSRNPGCAVSPACRAIPCTACIARRFGGDTRAAAILYRSTSSLTAGCSAVYSANARFSSVPKLAIPIESCLKLRFFFFFFFFQDYDRGDLLPALTKIGISSQLAIHKLIDDDKVH